MENILYIPYRELSKKCFVTQKFVPSYKHIHFVCLISLHKCMCTRLRVQPIAAPVNKYSRTPLIRTIWDGELSGYAENSNNYIFL